jgi:hypothetical protein
MYINVLFITSRFPLNPTKSLCDFTIKIALLKLQEIKIFENFNFGNWTGFYVTSFYLWYTLLSAKLIYVEFVSEANLVHYLFLVFSNLFLVHLPISTYFGLICAHHQKKQLYLCDTWYMLFCLADCLLCRVDWNYKFDW